MKNKLLKLGIVTVLVIMLLTLTGCGEQKSLENENKTNNKTEEKFYGSKAVKGNGTDIGDVITCGGEEFYVISNDGTNIKMLAKYNLYVGNYRNADDTGYTMHSYNESEATGIQHSSMKAGGNSNGKTEGITYYSSSETKGANNWQQQQLVKMGMFLKW